MPVVIITVPFAYFICVFICTLAFNQSLLLMVRSSEGVFNSTVLILSTFSLSHNWCCHYTEISKFKIVP